MLVGFQWFSISEVEPVAAFQVGVNPFRVFCYFRCGFTLEA